ncbi:ester cyclase [Deinococcus roseus]|uniref:Ester cyclase n=1 Tax=Deinococcus roseus TaxID=392414 RepID=A0ABQ2D059_9DEIO|nr:ester cyclase [Deinococcus roseus]GGJ37931.1 hypothetical protein GCM10008938_25030 [Deinococcus roseus]
MTDNKSIIQNIFAGWNNHNIEEASQYISEQCNSGGLTGFRQQLGALLQAMPDLHVTIEDILGEENKVATRITMRGTHLGPFLGFAPSGKPLTIKANHVYTLQDGLVTERYGQMDRLEVIGQMGLKMVPADT